MTTSTSRKARILASTTRSFIQPPTPPFTQSVLPYQSSHSQYQQTSHQSYQQPSHQSQYQHTSQVGANFGPGSQTTYWSPGPRQEPLGQLPRPTSLNAGRGEHTSSGRGGHANSSLRARGRGRGQGPTRTQLTRIQQTPTSTATTPTEPPLSMKQILDQFLPKSIVTMLPDSAKTFTPIVANQLEEVMKKVVAKEILAAELRVVAAKNCKKSFSQADGSFFMALENDLDIIRVIYCLVRRVSPERASRHIGEFKAMRDATLWNGFQASPEGQEVYRTHRGIKGKANSVLSDLWNEKTLDEKLTYQQYVRKSKNLTSVLLGAEGDDLNQTTGDSSDSVEPKSTGENGWVGSGRSLASAQQTAELWLAETEVEAKRIASLTNSNIVILCVSSHLGPNAFQMFAGSPRGRSWLKLNQERYGSAYCNCEFQSFCTGVAVAKLDTPGVKAKKSIAYPKQDQARAALKGLLKKTFPTKNYAWPWINCEARLLHWGAKIVLHPEAQTELGFVTQLSKNLNDEQGDCISTDITKGLFELAQVPKDSSGLKKRAPKRKREQESASEEGDEDETDEEENEDINE
ncbi:uncharacterized protein MELLADRAFT_76744 [Melampsora larici-populina 98AG31]|uniref:Uncharacterized protein n=1 Tax=Melampsora larici-populina (strain 98AG31 / pathotype 3-4-7) TaxID=747676 RepID=F4R947_MELLP|nr:uncharacterized protein MELLADRAFT_76744 [Melampsora larici-populina 98AG31]EGG10922.1 hypothetical protein MELLADRAFT_76744 [Melampsora larici-populina 98AG31]